MSLLYLCIFDEAVIISELQVRVELCKSYCMLFIRYGLVESDHKVRSSVENSKYLYHLYYGRWNNTPFEGTRYKNFLKMWSRICSIDLKYVLVVLPLISESSNNFDFLNVYCCSFCSTIACLSFCITLPFIYLEILIKFPIFSDKIVHIKYLWQRYLDV